MSKRSPRLLFTQEERTAPELKKAIQKADKAYQKLEKSEAKIPKKTVKKKQRVVDPKTGTVTTRLSFEEVDKKRPPSKLTHALRDAPGAAALSAVHGEIREHEQDNVGVESAHGVEQAAERAVRLAQHAHRSHKEKPYRRADRAEAKADRANLRALDKTAQHHDPQFSSNPYSRWQQKQAIKREYAAAKAGKSAGNTVKASEATAKAARKAAENTKKAGEFIARHKKGFLIVGGIAAMIVLILCTVSSCSLLIQGGATGVNVSTYPSEDADMLAAEAQYCAMEAELQQYLDTYESTHDYDEYHFELDDIEHDPYVLISAVTALMGREWTISEVGGILDMLFEKQYILTETVTTETRYRTETRTGYYTDAEGNLHSYEYTVQVPYTYYICTVRLENFNLSHVPVYMMGEEQLSLYATDMSTLGNRPDLFPSSGYVNKYIENPPTAWEIPSEYLTDERFNTLITEAEKYLGYPYVWGGSSPSTSFDCSGFVSYVLTNSGLCNTGRVGAQGLYNLSTPVSDSQPGDLVFFVGTYDTTGVSHVGIYVGDGMILHCGDPIQYSNLNTSYWQSHFYAYGRPPYN